MSKAVLQICAMCWLFLLRNLFNFTVSVFLTIALIYLLLIILKYSQ
jgi:hypothetical protein